MKYIKYRLSVTNGRVQVEIIERKQNTADNFYPLLWYIFLESKMPNVEKASLFKCPCTPVLQSRNIDMN
jgi:hypothetical protein